MERIYIHHDKWEDYKAGMYLPKEPESEAVHEAAKLLRSPEFGDMCMRVINEWPNSAAVNLSNPSKNRRAWLGRAVCCYFGGCTEAETRVAWFMLDTWEMDQANDYADNAIRKWKESVLITS